MNGILIEKYQPPRDRERIEHMLLNRKDLLTNFYKDEASNKDNILVASVNTVLAGFLSFNGFGRKPQATLYVSKEHDAMNIGSILVTEYEKMLIHNEQVEHTLFINCSDDSIKLLENQGYRLYFSSYIMERTGELFPQADIRVRNYDDEDYLAWDRICELAFYHMRQRVGMYPSYFYTPVEWEREQFAKNKDNMFVMTVDDTIVAIGKIDGNKISIVAVSIEHQSRGYGRPFVQFLVNEIVGRGEDKAVLEVVKGNFAKKLI